MSKVYEFERRILKSCYIHAIYQTRNSCKLQNGIPGVKNIELPWHICCDWQNIRAFLTGLVLGTHGTRDVEFYFSFVNYVSVISAYPLTSSLHYYQSRWQGRRGRTVRTRWPLFHRTLVGPWISNQSLMKSVVATGIYGHRTDPKVSTSHYRTLRTGVKE